MVAAAPAELAVGSTTSDGLVIKDFGNGQAVSCQLGKFRAVPREISPGSPTVFWAATSSLDPEQDGMYFDAMDEPTLQSWNEHMMTFPNYVNPSKRETRGMWRC